MPNNNIRTIDTAVTLTTSSAHPVKRISDYLYTCRFLLPDSCKKASAATALAVSQETFFQHNTIICVIVVICLLLNNLSSGWQRTNEGFRRLP